MHLCQQLGLSRRLLYVENFASHESSYLMFVYRYHAGGSWYALLIPRLILSSVYSSVPSVRLSICLSLSPAIFLSLSLSRPKVADQCPVLWAEWEPEGKHRRSFEVVAKPSYRLPDK